MSGEPTKAKVPRSVIYLALGSNLEDREANLRFAVVRLAEILGDIRCSSVYESQPVGVRDQPTFLNMVVVGMAELSPRAILTRIKSIEREAGRQRTFRWGPRVLDIDIALYGCITLDSPELTIPHPQLMARAFVRVPLCELNPDLVLPDGTPVGGPELEELARSQGIRILRGLGMG